VRAQHSDATVILGSATPSLESYHKARTGKFILLEITERIERRPLPPVTIVDMTDPKNREDPESSLSPLMQEALLETFHEGKLCLLFLNRRGYSNTLVCRDCGFLFRCPNCSITLTFHLAKKMLCCHYCDHHTRVPTMCPGCQGTGIRPVGRGTERIEQEIGALLQTARIGRMDRDTTHRKGSHERILTEFRDGNIDILIGTQMIAKGHDIPEVTFVGVVFADVSLDLPDFRAAERTFNLLTQVAGRAGRGVWPGRVLIQTFHPDHYCVQAAQRHDFGHFYSHEIVFRKELNYPPFSKLINLMISGTHEADSRQAATALGERARTLLATQKDYRDRIQVVGPSAAPLARLRGRYRFHLFVKSPSARHLHHFTRNLLTAASPVISGKAIRVQVDVDPLQVT
jgi:primosomal protein N' (replication factor Y)